MRSPRHALPRLVTRGVIAVSLSVGIAVASAAPAAAADRVVPVAPGSSTGPVAAEIGDVITIVGGIVVFADLEVPGRGTLPTVVVSTNASPITVSYASSGLMMESISFTYRSVVSPRDVPEQAILDAVSSMPIPGAILLTQVVEPPPPPPPPSPPPPPDVAPPSGEPQPTRTHSPRPQSAVEPTALSPDLTGGPAAAPAGGAAPAVPPPRGPNGGLSATRGASDGATIASTEVDATATTALDDLPMALGVPSLLAILSILVLGAGVGRLHLVAGRGRR